jgi:hypothetical protein
VAQVGAASEDAVQDSRTAPDFFDLDQRMMEDVDKCLSGRFGNLPPIERRRFRGPAKSLHLQEIFKGHGTLTEFAAARLRNFDLR